MVLLISTRYELLLRLYASLPPLENLASLHLRSQRSISSLPLGYAIPTRGTMCLVKRIGVHAAGVSASLRWPSEYFVDLLTMARLTDENLNVEKLTVLHRHVLLWLT